MNEAVEFLNWCNTPIYRQNGEISFKMRVQCLFPDYDTYVIIDETGNSILPKGKFLSAQDVYECFLKSKQQPK